METASVKNRSLHLASAKNILLVEDNPGDARLAREAFGMTRIATRLHIVSSGEATLDFLYRRAGYHDVPRPDLILLDLNLPRKSGSEVLGEIKLDPFLNPIPILVMTTSRAPEDIVNAYAKGANCYIVKPVEIEEFFRTVRLIEEFWFSLAQLPPSTN